MDQEEEFIQELKVAQRGQSEDLDQMFQEKIDKFSEVDILGLKL